MNAVSPGTRWIHTLPALGPDLALEDVTDGTALESCNTSRCGLLARCLGLPVRFVNGGAIVAEAPSVFAYGGTERPRDGDKEAIVTAKGCNQKSTRILGTLTDAPSLYPESLTGSP